MKSKLSTARQCIAEQCHERGGFWWPGTWPRSAPSNGPPDYLTRLRGPALTAALNHPSLAIDQLQFDQARQELDVVQALGSALARNFLILAQERRKLQRLEMMLQQDLGDMGHSAASDIRDM